MANEKTPKWFTGMVYDEKDSSYGDGIVRNPFSGEEYKLTPLEMSIYDFIKDRICQLKSNTLIRSFSVIFLP